MPNDDELHEKIAELFTRAYVEIDGKIIGLSRIMAKEGADAVMALIAANKRKAVEEAEQKGWSEGLRHKHYWFRDEPKSFCEGCGLPREEYEIV